MHGAYGDTHAGKTGPPPFAAAGTKPFTAKSRPPNALASAAFDDLMDAHTRHDRTVRLLAARLESLAVASIRSPGGERVYRDHILAAVAATRHAVALGLLSAEEAGAIWIEVATRHPEARWCATAPDLAGSLAA
jgi:hypothetical protein